ncbi:ubiquitin protein ligase sneaky [Anticarsia gemmatalis]|uniref:ubiquitin protein ligase sneaky n=1 Tax=Anticarsia gemmatalis TaxID=129554 RepID=UPI003F75D5EE
MHGKYALSHGLSNATSIQVRCICLLLLPKYCGRAGRGVLKIIVLTYVVAGPITNMGKNAREVVRVFACSTQLSYNLSKDQHSLMAEPLKKTALSLRNEMDQIKDALESISDIVAPIEHEVEGLEEVQFKQVENDFIDKLLCFRCRSNRIERDFRSQARTFRRHDNIIYQEMYKKKLAYRCENQLSHAVEKCAQAFEDAYRECTEILPHSAAWLMCWPLKLNVACNILHVIRGNGTCDTRNLVNPGFGEAYLALQRAKHELTDTSDVKLQYKVTYERELLDIQDAKETGERVIHAFEEKTTIMGTVTIALNLYVAFLFLRIAVAAVVYHDKYLTSIEYDNIYITRYFKRLDMRRKKKGEMTLLPLKKMERIKYIDVHSMSYKVIEHSKLLTQMLKVMLEVVTATTFVMLDRLFYEALDVVRQHAQADSVRAAGDLNIEVEGTGMLATLFRKLLSNISSYKVHHSLVSNEECVPRPHAMSTYYYFKIYGGYLWILLLLYINPYTLRLRRLTCSYFYPRREKQRILHLYNDILKKRMKMNNTLHRKAVQVVRAHYLSGENLLSLRMKFPHVLGWLRILPAARMTCLICGETEPRSRDAWHPCRVTKCPFILCGECWREAGGRCLACDPSLTEFSDGDSLSDDEHLKY